MRVWGRARVGTQGVGMCRCAGVGTCGYADVQECGCAGVQMCGCGGVPVSRCAGVGACACGGVQVWGRVNVGACGCADAVGGLSVQVLCPLEWEEVLGQPPQSREQSRTGSTQC